MMKGITSDLIENKANEKNNDGEEIGAGNIQVMEMENIKG